MLKSMTGYGKASAEFSTKKITAEIRSLNSKSFDLNMRISSQYREKESELRSELSKSLERGKIDFSLYSEYIGEAGTVSINKDLAKTYQRELLALSKELNEPNTNLLPLIIRMPDIMTTTKQELDETEWKHIKELVTNAIKAFNTFRDDEGATLKKDFDTRIGLINSLLNEVIKLDEQRVPNVRERLRKNVAELKSEVDQNRFEQELVYYVEKLDITEEKVRLKTHLDYFIKTMAEPASGRKLGFITQEIGREINTIGSKANDAGIQKTVVQMKDELEKIKEQVNNVL